MFYQVLWMNVHVCSATNSLLNSFNIAKHSSDSFKWLFLVVCTVSSGAADTFISSDHKNSHTLAFDGKL